MQQQFMPFGWPYYFPIVEDNDLLINSIITTLPGPPGPPGPVGPVGPQGPAGTPGLVPVTIVTTTPFNATTSEYFLGVAVDGAASIVLPVSPTGTIFIVKDIQGDAAANPITVTASTPIDGAAAATIDTDYGAIQLSFNGTEWSIV